MKRFLAIIVLLLLLVVPFFNWRAGAVLWLIAWTVYLVKSLHDKRSVAGGQGENGEEEEGG